MTDPFAPARPAPTLPPPEPTDGRRPRLLAHVLRYLDWHGGGAERMVHGILRGLQQRGWDVVGVTVENRHGLPLSRACDGVPVQVLTDAQMAEPYAWCDVALTHLDVTSSAMAWARYGRPLGHVVHNHRQLEHHRVPDDGHNFAIWNSEWIANEHAGWKGPSIVCRPPVHAAEHKTTNAKRYALKSATLVNLLGEKGGPQFWQLAERCPDWQFIGVEGAYGKQWVADPLPPNGEFVPQTGDLRPVWKRTGVYLCPSWYESFGLAAVEAMTSGIPVVAHPTPGLRESMTSPEHGECAWFVDRDDQDGWVHALERLAKANVWREWSKKARLRAAEIEQQTETDLDRLDRFCRSLISVV